MRLAKLQRKVFIGSTGKKQYCDFNKMSLEQQFFLYFCEQKYKYVEIKLFIFKLDDGC